MTDFVGVATQFTQFYYQTFDTNRAQLQSLYRPNSMLSFETTDHMGAADITKKLTELPFNQVRHSVATTNAQPAGADGSILVMVTGSIFIDGSDYPQLFCQTFHLIPDAGTYYVLNDIFRLVYGAS